MKYVRRTEYNGKCCWSSDSGGGYSSDIRSNLPLAKVERLGFCDIKPNQCQGCPAIQRRSHNSKSQQKGAQIGLYNRK